MTDVSGGSFFPFFFFLSFIFLFLSHSFPTHSHSGTQDRDVKMGDGRIETYWQFFLMKPARGHSF